METEIIYDQVDNHGKRYRRVGNCIEYEPVMVLASGLNVPTSKLSAVTSHLNEQERSFIKESNKHMDATGKHRECPFKAHKNAFDTQCKYGCAFMIADRCQLLNLDDGSTLETEVKDCPITGRKCTKRCELYNNGCVVVKGLQKGLQND